MLRRVILGGEIPTTISVGLALNSPRNISFISAVDRDRSCQESIIAVAPNVPNIIFVGDMGEAADIEEKIGVIITGNAQWRSEGVYRCRLINPERHVFATAEPVSAKFFVHKAARYHSMAESAAAIGDNTYFPLNTVYALIGYVRVLPLTRDAIEVRYYDGMTPGLSLDIWNAARN